MGAVEELCDDDEDCLNEVDEEVTNLEGECGDDDKECWKNGMEAKMEEMKKGKKEKKGKKGKKGDVMKLAKDGGKAAKDLDLDDLSDEDKEALMDECDGKEEECMK